MFSFSLNSYQKNAIKIQISHIYLKMKIRKLTIQSVNEHVDKLAYIVSEVKIDILSLKSNSAKN